MCFPKLLGCAVNLSYVVFCLIHMFILFTVRCSCKVRVDSGAPACVVGVKPKVSLNASLMLKAKTAYKLS